MEHRVQKLLSNYGYCSRRKGEELIEQGKVKVNGKIVSLGDKATETDKIEVEGKLVNKESKVYIKFNKPLGCVTAVRDNKYKTVLDYVKVKERVFPIGRLDYNTTGLLILTNDGDFANKVMHPRYELDKTYEVETDTPVTKDNIVKLEKGIMLSDGITAPAKVKIISENVVHITIHEGRNRIVRRMFNVVGYKVRKLKRVQIGKLKLGDLKIGEFIVSNKKFDV